MAEALTSTFYFVCLVCGKEVPSQYPSVRGKADDRMSREFLVFCFKPGFYIWHLRFFQYIYYLVQSEREAQRGGVFDQSGAVRRPAASTDFLTNGCFGLFCFSCFLSMYVYICFGLF